MTRKDTCASLIPPSMGLTIPCCLLCTGEGLLASVSYHTTLGSLINSTPGLFGCCFLAQATQKSGSLLKHAPVNIDRGITVPAGNFLLLPNSATAPLQASDRPPRVSFSDPFKERGQFSVDDPCAKLVCHLCNGIGRQSLKARQAWDCLISPLSANPSFSFQLGIEASRSGLHHLDRKVYTHNACSSPAAFRVSFSLTLSCNAFCNMVRPILGISSCSERPIEGTRAIRNIAVARTS